MKSTPRLTTSEQLAQVLADHTRDSRPGGTKLVSAHVREEGVSPHKKHFACFTYEDGSREEYGPVANREYGWTRR